MPYAKENSMKEYEKEAWGTMRVFNVTQPTLTVYAAKGVNSGKAVVIFPGGGYSMEAICHEGHDVAKALSKQGITPAVLKYRLPNPVTSDKPELLPITDAQKALNMRREMADKYGFKKDAVGVMGFSAGGHLAALASSKNKERPDFALIIYGCPRLNDENIKWLENDLFHRKMTPAEFDEFNLIERVSSKTPPTFLVHSIDDKTCSYLETTLYAQALLENGVENEVHLFPKGGHGLGLGRREDGTDQWIELAIKWIKRQ
jgi:acetyl esterase/lipase